MLFTLPIHGSRRGCVIGGFAPAAATDDGGGLVIGGADPAGGYEYAGTEGVDA